MSQNMRENKGKLPKITENMRDLEKFRLQTLLYKGFLGLGKIPELRHSRGTLRNFALLCRSLGLGEILSSELSLGYFPIYSELSYMGPLWNWKKF